MKNIFAYFKSNKSPDSHISKLKINAIQINNGWNADPVSPDVSVEVNNNDLLMTINLNYFAFENYNEGDKAKITFIKFSRYSLNSGNDEGYYLGQYRIKHDELAFGEFYEIISGVDRKFPEPVISFKAASEKDRHFIFFFKDETFECLAEDYKIEFL